MNTGWWEIDSHGCYSLVKIAFLCQFARARTIDEYDVTMLVSPVRVTPQINYGDDNYDMSDWCLFLEKLCVKDIKLRVRNKIIHSLPGITIFGSLVRRFTNDFHSWLRHSWKSLANRLTRDPKIFIHGNSCIILYITVNGPHNRAGNWKYNNKLDHNEPVCIFHRM